MVAFVLCLVQIDAFSNMMTRNHCDRELAEGTVIMGQPVQIDSTRRLRLFRGEEELLNGSLYHSSEKLSVQLEPYRATQLVFEVISTCGSSAYFENKGNTCNGKRSNSQGAFLVMPYEENCVVTISCGWSSSFSSGVKLCSPFQLNGGLMHSVYDVHHNGNDDL